MIVDGLDFLITSYKKMFNLIYINKKIPDQWLISKTIPIFKNKGDKKDIENYRPISNLCTSSKIFEKLILKRILEIQESQSVDITGENQHGFKKRRSTATLSLSIQSMIASVLEDDCDALMASLDLSAAFDTVNIPLLIKRLKIN